MKRFVIASVLAVVLAGTGLLAQAGSTDGDFEGQGIIVRDIAFDGYCDGAHLVVNMNNAVVTGNTTGCIDDSLLGVYGSVQGKAGVSYCTNYGGLTSMLLFLIHVDGTWEIWATDGSFVNSGTWSYGVPPGPEAEGLSPSAAG